MNLSKYILQWNFSIHLILQLNLVFQATSDYIRIRRALAPFLSMR